MPLPIKFKLVCPKCGYSKIVDIKSDVITNMQDLEDLKGVCPKCGTYMEKKELNKFESFIKDIFG